MLALDAKFIMQIIKSIYNNKSFLLVKEKLIKITNLKLA